MARGRKLDDVARESNIHSATLSRWIQQFRADKLALDVADGIPPSHRHPGEKLTLLLETMAGNAHAACIVEDTEGIPAKVCEVDPFLCPQCGGRMSVIAVMQIPVDIRSIISDEGWQ